MTAGTADPGTAEAGRAVRRGRGSGTGTDPARAAEAARAAWAAIPVAEICRDPGRAMVYEHGLEPFLDAGTAGMPVMGTCRICRAQVPVTRIERATGEGMCLAQFSITTKRGTKLPEGAAPVVGAPGVKGHNSFNEIDFCLLASPRRSLVATTIAPLREPPAHVEARLKRDVRPFDFVMDLLLRPPEAPFTAIHWSGRAAAIPIVPTTFADILVMNGGPEPVEIDRRRFASGLAAARRIGGLAAFDDAAALREAIAERASHVIQRAGGKTRRVPVGEALAALGELRLDDLAAALRALPSRRDVETRYVRAALRDEEERTGRATEGDAP